MHTSDFGGFFTHDNGHTTRRNLMTFQNVKKFDLFYVHAKIHYIWQIFKGQIPSVYEQKYTFFTFLNRFIFFTLNEIIRSLRESLYNDLYIDNQKKCFELLVQNP